MGWNWHSFSHCLQASSFDGRSVWQYQLVGFVSELRMLKAEESKILKEEMGQ